MTSVSGLRGRVAMPLALPRVNPKTQRFAQVVIAAMLVGWMAYVIAMTFGGFAQDYQAYNHIGLRVLGGGPLYTADQLAGPHFVTGGWDGESMYPPSSLPLFLAFAVIPQPFSLVLWYVIPLGTIAYVLWRLRPTGWRLIVILTLTAYAPSMNALWLGNPGLWAVAGLSLGALYRWPAAFVFIKPTMAPLALLGLRDRRWWIVAAGFALLSLAMLPLTFDWIRVLLNARGPFASLGYGLSNLPLFLVPLAASAKKPAPAEAEAGGVVAG